MTNRFLRTAIAAAMVSSIAACGGTDEVLGPQIELTEAQTEDMMDALDAIGSFEGSLRTAAASVRNSGIALYSYTIDESDTCPEGGTTRAQGTVSGSDNGTSASANLTQTYTNCSARSSSNTLWTFNGAPNLKMVFNSTYNLSTGAFSANGTVNGAIKASSGVGSGSCSISITYTETGNDSGFSGSATGTVCGKPYSETFNETW